ncbi:MAG: DUF177 domain-containing protein [Kiloniellaceae bacterium]
MPGPVAEAPSEFSRIVTPDRLGGPKLVESLEATSAERAAVARRLGILAVDRLVAELAVKAFGGGLYRVEGGWEATVSQACVVTLEPVEAGLSGRVEATYEAADSVVAGEGGEVTVDPEAADPAEILPPEGIDLGELVVQELAVALDPYPRAPGAEVPAEYRPPEAEEETGPFAALKALKGDR